MRRDRLARLNRAGSGRRLVADRAYVLDDGKVVYSGAAAEFAKDEERVRALAGASAAKWEEV